MFFGSEHSNGSDMDSDVEEASDPNQSAIRVDPSYAGSLIDNQGNFSYYYSN
jgi:hypothetical protein